VGRRNSWAEGRARMCEPWPPQRNGRSRSRWSKRVIIEPRFSPDQRRQINDLPPAEVLAKDRLPCRTTAFMSSRP